MPCQSCRSYDSGPSASERELAKLKDAFCSACTKLEALGEPIPDAARLLWEEHKAEDARRIKRETAERSLRLERKAALKKLSQKERDILGLRGEE